MFKIDIRIAVNNKKFYKSRQPMLHAYMHFITSFKIMYLMPTDGQYDRNM